MEEFRTIAGYEGLYSVSNLGNVRNDLTGRILKPSLNSRDYKRVRLCKNAKTKNYFIHRLVAFAFIPNPDNLPVVNHLDEDRTNNRVDNLEWCTTKYNVNYGTARQRHSETCRIKREKREAIKAEKKRKKKELQAIISKEKKAIRAKRYYLKHREEILAKQRENEGLKEYKKRYRQEHREEINAYMRDYHKRRKSA